MDYSFEVIYLSLIFFLLCSHMFSILMLDCRMLLDQEWTVLPHHVFSEANCVTDELTKRGWVHQCLCLFYLIHVA